MRIAVFSDTHGYTAPMADAVARCRPDAVFHLGDHDRDTEVLLRQFPEIPLYNVAGNCDFAALAPNVLTVSLGPVKAFLTTAICITWITAGSTQWFTPRRRKAVGWRFSAIPTSPFTRTSAASRS